MYPTSKSGRDSLISMVFSCFYWWCYSSLKSLLSFLVTEWFFYIQTCLSFRRKLARIRFGEVLTVFSTKVNLLNLLYLMALKWCFLHLIKWNFLLNTFLKNMILMTLVSGYLVSGIWIGVLRNFLPNI